MRKDDWLKLEHAEAARDGAKPQKNSGRGINKGDARLDGFTIDYKFSGKSFSITKEVWAKICEDALSNDYDIPTIKVILGETDSKTRLWLIDDNTFHDMLEVWKERNEVQKQSN